MRTLQQINKIKKNYSPAVQELNFLSSKRAREILEIYKTSDKVEKKVTGPSVLYIKEGDGILDEEFDRLRTTYGNFKVRNAQIFDVTFPHVLHNDDGKDLPNVYKAFTIPLEVYGGNPNDAKLIMFDQYYYGGPAKFFGGDSINESMHYNIPVTDYKDIENFSEAGIPQELQKFFTHLKSSWLTGLTVSSYFPWTIGSCIAFDCLRIHCASDFRKAGITRKIGISIFTTID